MASYWTKAWITPVPVCSRGFSGNLRRSVEDISESSTHEPVALLWACDHLSCQVHLGSFGLLLADCRCHRLVQVAKRLCTGFHQGHLDAVASGDLLGKLQLQAHLAIKGPCAGVLAKRPQAFRVGPTVLPRYCSTSFSSPILIMRRGGVVSSLQSG